MEKMNVNGTVSSVSKEDKLFKISEKQAKAIGKCSLIKHIDSKDDTIMNTAKCSENEHLVKAVQYLNELKRTEQYKRIDYAQGRRKALYNACSKIEQPVLKEYCLELLDRKANRMYSKILFLEHNLEFVPNLDTKEYSFRMVKTVRDQDKVVIENETLFLINTKFDYVTLEDIFMYFSRIDKPIPNKLIDIVLYMNDSFKSGKKEGIQEFVKSAKCIGLAQMKDDHRKFLVDVLKMI